MIAFLLGMVAGAAFVLTYLYILMAAEYYRRNKKR